MNAIPTLSIVSITYNNLAGLKKTMKSVLEQTFTGYEYIIIDGGSSDGSREYVEENADKLVYAISERDKGVYDAMNKGIKVAKGEYLFFLNSGDRLVTPNTLERVWTDHHKEDIVFGNLLIEDISETWEKNYPDQPSFKYFLTDSLPHSGGAFIRRELFERVGLYDESVKISSDWMFYLDAIFNHKSTLKYLAMPISYFDYDGLSSRPENRELLESEKLTFLEKEFPLHYEHEKLKQQHHLLINSRIIKLYFRIKTLFQSSKIFVV